MQIQTHCQCGARFAFSEEQVGQAFRCSVCHQVFHVPPPGQKPVMSPMSETPAQVPPPQPKQYIPPPQMAPPRRSSGSGLGCLLLAFLLFVGLVVGGISLLFVAAERTTTAISESMSSINGMVQMAESLEVLANPEKIIAKYKDQGYEHVIAQSKTDSETITKDRLYTCQVLDLKADSEANLAILSQAATIRGEVNGDVDFFGQMLVIEKGAVIHGDLNLGFAQSVEVKGMVEGKLSGGYQILRGKDNIKGGVEANGALVDLIREEIQDKKRGQVEKPDVTVEIESDGKKEKSGTPQN